MPPTKKVPEPKHSPGDARAGLTTSLAALIVGQIGLHSCMAGIRMAAPLQALRQGHTEWAVGVLLGLFAAAPIVLALHAGRLADRHGYHRPMRIAVGFTVVGGLVAVLSTWLGDASFAVMCVAACLVGAGANFGLIAIQRSASRVARDGTDLKRVFSWLGLAPALSNVVGPVLAGSLIDLGGFRSAFIALTLLPLLSLWWARRVPVEIPSARSDAEPKRNSWDLLKTPGLRRLLLVNWLTSSSWDVHTFVVPILSHERGFSASAIGWVLGVFAASVAMVRLVIPALAHRLRESAVLAGAMLLTAAAFVIYPLASTAWAMMGCAIVLGVALGAVQPMIMTALHQITPEQRQGEVIGLRSIIMSLSSTVMPLMFGLAGAAMGAATLFWLMAAALSAGSIQARRIGHGAAPRDIRT
jgi:MFS family permease